jgi:hypothetical protein
VSFIYQCFPRFPLPPENWKVNWKPLSTYFPPTFHLLSTMANQKLSMRQFASHLGTTHTTVKSIMETLGITGESQGSGKATLLSWEEQEAIANEFFKKDSKPSEPIVEVIPVEIDVYSPTEASYSLSEGAVGRLIGSHHLSNSLDSLKRNFAATRHAMLAKLAEEGAAQGYEMYQIYQNSMVSTFERLSAQGAEQMGLTQVDPTDTSDNPDL